MEASAKTHLFSSDTLFEILNKPSFYNTQSLLWTAILIYRNTQNVKIKEIIIKMIHMGVQIRLYQHMFFKMNDVNDVNDPDMIIVLFNKLENIDLCQVFLQAIEYHDDYFVRGMILYAVNQYFHYGRDFLYQMMQYKDINSKQTALKLLQHRDTDDDPESNTMKIIHILQNIETTQINSQYELKNIFLEPLLFDPKELLKKLNIQMYEQDLTCFLEACQKGDARTAIEYLKNNLYFLYAANSVGAAALTLAIEHNQFEIIVLLTDFKVLQMIYPDVPDKMLQSIIWYQYSLKLRGTRDTVLYSMIDKELIAPNIKEQIVNVLCDQEDQLLDFMKLYIVNNIDAKRSIEHCIMKVLSWFDDFSYIKNLLRKCCRFYLVCQ